MKNQNNTATNWNELASKSFCIGFFLLCIYLVLKYAVSVFIPFAVAYVFSLAVVPMADFLSRKSKLPKKLCAAVCVSIIFALAAFFLFWGVKRLSSEVGTLVADAAQGRGDIARVLAELGRIIEEVSSKVGIAETFSSNMVIESGGMGARIAGFIYDLSTKAVSAVSSHIGGFVGKTLSTAPSFFISSLVTLVSCFYFCMYKESISSGIKSLLPAVCRDRMLHLISVAKLALVRYAKAYLVLMALTFVEIFAGLIILKVKYEVVNH